MYAPACSASPSRRTRTRLLAPFAVALIAAGVDLTPASAGPVAFTNIIDASLFGHGTITDGSAPSASGTSVALRIRYIGGEGIFTGNMGASGVAKVVDASDTAPGHGAFTSFLGTPTISGSTVAFYGNYGSGTGIYTGTVGATGAALIVDRTSTAPGQGAFTGFGTPAISGNNIAFAGDYSGGSGIYTGSVGSTGATKRVDTSDNAPGNGAFTGFDAPSISGNTIAFVGNYSSGSGLYTGSVGTTGATKVVDTDDNAPGHGAFTSFGFYFSVSGSNIAFSGNYTGGNGLYAGTVGVAGATKIVDTDDIAPGHGVFTSFGYAAGSGSNVAFVGYYGGGSGLYLESGGQLSTIISTGDALFGSTVAGLSLANSGYDNDVIAFAYILSSNQRGVAVATVPEPGCVSLLALAALPMVRRRHRRIAP